MPPADASLEVLLFSNGRLSAKWQNVRPLSRVGFYCSSRLESLALHEPRVEETWLGVVHWFLKCLMWRLPVYSCTVLRPAVDESDFFFHFYSFLFPLYYRYSIQFHYLYATMNQHLKMPNSPKPENPLSKHWVNSDNGKPFFPSFFFNPCFIQIGLNYRYFMGLN